MKRALLLGLVLVGTGLVAPATAEGSYGTTAGTNGVLYDDCLDYPYRYAVDLPDGATSWGLDVSLVGPDGREADTDFVAADEPTGTSTFFLCPPTDPYGGYTIHATLQWTDTDAVEHDAALPDSHFTMRKPRTTTRLSASTRRPAYRKFVTFRIRVADERPTGYVGTPFTWVRLQKRVHGEWVGIKGSRAMTHSTGAVKVRVRYTLRHHKPMRVRAVTAATPRYAGSTSPVIRLW
jgi:hypothetical protein